MSFWSRRQKLIKIREENWKEVERDALFPET